MKKNYKVLKSWDAKYPVDAIIEMDADADQTKELITAGGIEEYDPVAALELQKAKDAEDKAFDDKLAKGIKDGLEALVKGLGNKSADGNLKVGASPEDKMKFVSLGDQCSAIVKSKSGHEESHKRVEACIKVATASGLNEAVDSEGGFLVQTDIQQELEREIFEQESIMAEAQMVEISNNANAHQWNAVDDSDRSDGNRRGGITVSRTHEATSSTESKPKFERRKIEVEKLTGHYFATEELLADAPGLNAEVTDWFSEEFIFVITDEMIRGKGGGEALGILNADAAVSVAKEDSQTATTIVAENVEKMYARLKARSRAKSKWYINQDIWPQLFQLQHTVGTGGVPVFIPPGGIVGQPSGLLLGRPIVELEQCSTVGTKGDIIYADWSQYKLARKGGVQSAASIHVKFLEGETALRFTTRINGQPKQRTAMTPANGSNTQSSFVVLDTRS